MKTCNEIREVLAEMLDDGCEEAVRTEVVMHLESCQECSKQFSQLQKIQNAMRDLPVMQVSAGFNAALAAKIRQQSGTKVIDLPQRQSNNVRPLWTKLLAYAAGFGIMAVGFVALEQQGVFKSDAPLLPSGQPVFTQSDSVTKPAVNVAVKVNKTGDSIKNSNTNDSLKHLKLVTPNEDKIYRVSHE